MHDPFLRVKSLEGPSGPRDAAGGGYEFAEAGAVDSAHPAEVHDDAHPAGINENVHGLAKLHVPMTVHQAAAQLEQRHAGSFLEVKLHGRPPFIRSGH